MWDDSSFGVYTEGYDVYTGAFMSYGDTEAAGLADSRHASARGERILERDIKGGGICRSEGAIAPLRYGNAAEVGGCAGEVGGAYILL